MSRIFITSLNGPLIQHLGFYFNFENPVLWGFGTSFIPTRRALPGITGFAGGVSPPLDGTIKATSS
jgi:hypothetical protein